MALQPGQPTTPTLNDARHLLDGLTAHAGVDPLETLAELDTIAREAVDAMDAVVVEARRRGFSWREIGLATGLTSHGAGARWSDVVDKAEAVARGFTPRPPDLLSDPVPKQGPQHHHRPPGSWDRGLI